MFVSETKVLFLVYGYVQGTGSYPLPPHGLHEAILFMVSQPPLKGPCFLRASIPYAEQLGVYLHEGGKYGEIAYW
jgi:hypothetical protein